MPLSFRKFNSTGAATYPIGFSYISPDHIAVTVKGEPRASGFSLANGNITFTSPIPESGAEIRIYRTTPGRTEATKNTTIVDFVNGATLSESDLDAAVRQNFYLVQEAQDTAEGNLLAPGSVAEPMLADGCVSTRVLADGAVKEVKMGDNSVSTKTIVANAVTTEKVANGNVTEPKLAADAVSTRTIAAGAVTEAKIDAAWRDTVAYEPGNNVFTGSNQFNNSPTVPLVPTAAGHATSKQYVDIGDSGYQGSTPSELNLPVGSVVLAVYYSPNNFLPTSSQANQTMKVWCDRWTSDASSNWFNVMSSYVVTASTDGTVPETQELTPRPFFQLQGTWKCRGFFNQSAGSAYIFLVQRIA